MVLEAFTLLDDVLRESGLVMRRTPAEATMVTKERRTKYLSAQRAGLIVGAALAVVGLSPASARADACTDVGGSPMHVEGVKTCKVNQATCPAGWKPYKNWTTTANTYEKAGCNCVTCTCTTPADSFEQFFSSLYATVTDVATRQSLDSLKAAWSNSTDCRDCFSGEHTTMANKAPETSLGKRAVACGNIFTYFSCTARVTSRLCVK
jgi:hypothetical protein